jgi:lycopene cyclase domain-containing protein
VTYTAAALLGVAGALVLDLLVLRTALVWRAVFWATYPILITFQLVSNGVLTGRGIVRYAPDAILGWRLGYAPVEDLLFGFALILSTLSIWVWLGRHGVQPTPRAGAPRPPVEAAGARTQAAGPGAGRVNRRAGWPPRPVRAGLPWPRGRWRRRPGRPRPPG